MIIPFPHTRIFNGEMNSNKFRALAQIHIVIHSLKICVFSSGCVTQTRNAIVDDDSKEDQRTVH